MLELCDGVDLLIHDAQYTQAEFREKAHWGHCTIEYALLVAKEAGAHRLAKPGLKSPVAVVGIIAPALTDSLHPSFYLHALMIGAFLKTRWDVPEPPLSSCR